jgi:hypothetical protein
MKRKRTEWPIVVLGSSFVGLGAACAAPDQVLVIERSMLVGSEWIAGYQAGEIWNKEAVTVAARELRLELIQRGLIGEGGAVHLPAMAPVLFRWIKEHQLQVQFLSETIGIEPSGDGYDVTLYNASGYQRIRAGQILDTTGECLSQPERRAASPTSTGKAIHAMLHGPDSLETGVMIEREGLTATVTPGLLPGEALLRLPLSVDAGWPVARRSLHEFWKARPEAWRDWTITAVADVFTVEAPRGPHLLAPGLTWLPACAYANGVEGFDAGQSWIQREEQGHDFVTTG